jgi:hypothetical protein
MTLLKTFIDDFREGFRAMAEPRDAWFYYYRRFITAREYIVLQRLEQANGGEEC